MVIANAVFFEIAKPDWTQIGTLTLFDAAGEVIMTDETRLHGLSCSSRLYAPPTPDAAIPAELDAGRRALAEATHSCRAGTIAGLAVGDGPYFDVPLDDLAAELRDLDYRTGLFGAMTGALLFRPEEIEGVNGPIYLFDWNARSNNPQEGPFLRVELGFSEDGVWQYGVILEP